VRESERASWGKEREAGKQELGSGRRGEKVDLGFRRCGKTPSQRLQIKAPSQNRGCEPETRLRVKTVTPSQDSE
jgi:hypothetical protein